MIRRTVFRKSCITFVFLSLFLYINACNSGTSKQADLEPAKPADDRPDILLIVADDLGYSALAAYGGEIDTPNLDRLARSGVLMTNYHGDGTWELFDLTRDPGETRDLKSDPGYEGIFTFLMEEYSRYSDECGMIEYGPEDAPRP